MSKKSLKLQDLSFYGDASSSKYHASKYIEWDRSSGDSKLVFFTDQCLPMAQLPQYKNSYKVAWILEPFVISPNVYEYIDRYYSNFDLILTHHIDYVKRIPNACWYPSCMSWIAKDDWKKYDKTKNMSIIASEKNYAPGHILRHDIINYFGNTSNIYPFDIYGRGYNPVEHKIEALKDYKFSLTIENCRKEFYFTEKLIDCFATHTCPIYYGSPELELFFNIHGIITIDGEGISSANSIIKDVTDNIEDIYNSKGVQEALEDNFNLAIEQYMVAEDWIFVNVLKRMGLDSL